MKKWVFVLCMVILLCGCAGNKENKEVLTRLSEFPDNSFDISTIEKADCYLGGGRVYTLSDASHIKDIYHGLMNISVDTASYEEEVYIDDGDILFCFIDKDGTEHGIDFLTSEYYYDEGKYYTVRERQKLRELMDRVVDYYQMEAENGE